jgi:D-glycero-D-manno-heptose 1,7-bisphosphate phosphatase
MPGKPAVFLDRDNTMIHNDGDLGDPDEVRLMQGVAPAIGSLCGLGYKVVVVTNQGGVARGMYTEDDVKAVHERIEQLVAERSNGARIDAFYYCPYHPRGKVAKYKKEHPTRKPKPGMLFAAEKDLGLDLSQSWMVGDALRDIEAGLSAGTRTILLEGEATGAALLRGPNQSGSSKRKTPPVEPHFIARGLVEAVRIIASQRAPEAAEQVSQTRVAGKRWDAASMAALQKPRPKPMTQSTGSDEESPKSDPDAEAEPNTHTVDTSPQAEASVELQQPEAEPSLFEKPTPQAKPARPFRPWTAPEHPEPTTAERLAQAAKKLKRPRTEHTHNPATEHTNEAQPPALKLTDSPTADSPSDIADSQSSEASTGLPIDPPTSEELQQVNKNLRMILSELRVQRGTVGGDGDRLRLIAVILQGIALICLLGGLWMGGGAGGTAVFLRWLGVAMILQLGSIAALLSAGPRE